MRPRQTSDIYDQLDKLVADVVWGHLMVLQDEAIESGADLGSLVCHKTHPLLVDDVL